MKYLSITLTMILVAFMANAQSCPDDNHPHAIDLGLPSGTKWACCNVGADSPEDYGGYYAWGETEEKSKYDWSNYIHCDGSKNTCYDIGSDIAGTEYDVAHVQWGGIWKMPSEGQIQELISNCSYTWTTKNGVVGGLLTGQSNGTIFLPEADICWNGFLECYMPGGYYWSSTLCQKSSNNAYRLCFDSWGGSSGGEYRGIGLTVRPIISGNINDPNIIIHLKSSADDTSQAIYDLQGRQLRQAPTKGVYIQNGKKRVVK